MNGLLVYVITLLYGFAGLVTFCGFIPTMLDLWQGKPSANAATYFTWSITTFFTSLYGFFVLRDLMFNVILNLQLLACIIILMLLLRLKIKKRGCNVRQRRR